MDAPTGGAHAHAHARDDGVAGGGGEGGGSGRGSTASTASIASNGSSSSIISGNGSRRRRSSFDVPGGVAEGGRPKVMKGVYDQFKAALPMLVEVLDPMVASGELKSITVTGHSLGGALACMATLKICERYYC